MDNQLQDIRNNQTRRNGADNSNQVQRLGLIISVISLSVSFTANWSSVESFILVLDWFLGSAVWGLIFGYASVVVFAGPIIMMGFMGNLRAQKLSEQILLGIVDSSMIKNRKLSYVVFVLYGINVAWGLLWAKIVTPSTYDPFLWLSEFLTGFHGYSDLQIDPVTNMPEPWGSFIRIWVLVQPDKTFHSVVRFFGWFLLLFLLLSFLPNIYRWIKNER